MGSRRYAVPKVSGTCSGCLISFTKERGRVRAAMVRAGDHPQRTGIMTQLVEIEEHLDVLDVGRGTVRVDVPVHVAVEQVAVAFGVLVVVTQQRPRDRVEPRVVPQPRQLLALVDECRDDPARLALEPRIARAVIFVLGIEQFGLLAVNTSSKPSRIRAISAENSPRRIKNPNVSNHRACCGESAKSPLPASGRCFRFRIDISDNPSSRAPNEHRPRPRRGASTSAGPTSADRSTWREISRRESPCACRNTMPSRWQLRPSGHYRCRIAPRGAGDCVDAGPNKGNR